MRKISVLFCAASLLAGCGEGRSSADRASLAQGLEIYPGATVTSAEYTIRGMAAVVVQTGTVPVGNSPDVPVTVSGLPVGQYEIRLKATASDGETECESERPFNVTQANATITVIVHLECDLPPGSANVGATLNVCPVLDGLSASPVVLNVGGVSTLSVQAHDSDNVAAPLTYSWTANGVTLTQQMAPTLAFTCSSVGPVTIGASVSDGQCADSASAEVVCQ